MYKKEINYQGKEKINNQLKDEDVAQMAGARNNSNEDSSSPKLMKRENGNIYSEVQMITNQKINILRKFNLQKIKQQELSQELLK